MWILRRTLTTPRGRLTLLTTLIILSLTLYTLHPPSLPSLSAALALFPINPTYTRTLVIPQTSGSDYTWLTTEIPDLLSPTGPWNVIFYSTDNQSAAHHTPSNRGHEAMAYLSYLIDAYDALPDVTVFMHGGATEWHNNRLLNDSSALTLRCLNLAKVVRDGYVNLLCEWQGNCPAHIRPHTENFDPGKPEETLFADVWPELFEGERAPDVLAQACCSQFAVARERIRAVPRERFERLRDWLGETYLDDHDSGRIFEYVWQYLFAGTPVFCPDPMVCYCEMYGVCFASARRYEEFFALRRGLHCREKELEELDLWDSANGTEALDEDFPGIIFGESGFVTAETSVLPLDDSGRPAPGLREKLVAKAEEKKVKLAALQREALEYGSNPQRRMKAIEARKQATDTLLDEVQCNRDRDA